MNKFFKYINETLSIFPNTKVCLRKGRPMELYRGISKSREERHPSHLLGIFATPNINTAKAYSGEGGKLLTIYMNIENPYYMEYDEIQSIKNSNDAKALKNKLIKKGYDGIFLKPMKDSGAHPNDIREYIAFNMNQIKEI